MDSLRIATTTKDHISYRAFPGMHVRSTLTSSVVTLVAIQLSPHLPSSLETVMITVT